MGPTSTDYTKIRVAVEFITPERAAELLILNTRNRLPNEKSIRAFARHLEAGGVEVSNDAITVSSSNVLINGQNRLTACVRAGVGFPAIVAHGIPDAVQLVMDTGGRRTFAQHLALAYGEGDATAKAGATSTLWDYTNGVYTHTGNFLNAPSHHISDLDALWRLRRDEIIAGVAAARRCRRAGIEISPSVLAVAHITLNGLDGEDADYFFGHLVSGVGLPDGSPILALIRWSGNLAKGAGSKPASSVQLAIVVKAWNAFRDGRAVGLLRYRPGGANAESFPEPK